jgi:hypothetical protein
VLVVVVLILDRVFFTVTIPITIVSFVTFVVAAVTLIQTPLMTVDSSNVMRRLVRIVNVSVNGG